MYVRFKGAVEASRLTEALLRIVKEIFNINDKRVVAYTLKEDIFVVWLEHGYVVNVYIVNAEYKGAWEVEVDIEFTHVCRQ